MELSVFPTERNFAMKAAFWKARNKNHGIESCVALLVESALWTYQFLPACEKGSSLLRGNQLDFHRFVPVEDNRRQDQISRSFS